MKEHATFDGKAGTTFYQISTNTAQSLTAANILNSRGAIITVEDQTIRYSFNTNAVQGVNGPGHSAAAGTVIRLNSGSLVQNLSFISETADAHGTLQVTPLK